MTAIPVYLHFGAAPHLHRRKKNRRQNSQSRASTLRAASANRPSSRATSSFLSPLIEPCLAKWMSAECIHTVPTCQDLVACLLLCAFCLEFHTPAEGPTRRAPFQQLDCDSDIHPCPSIAATASPLGLFQILNLASPWSLAIAPSHTHPARSHPPSSARNLLALRSSTTPGPALRNSLQRDGLFPGLVSHLITIPSQRRVTPKSQNPRRQRKKTAQPPAISRHLPLRFCRTKYASI